MSIIETANANMKKLTENTYPGRGIVQGMTPNGQHLVQVYWIMGRSENSRNRIFEIDGEFVKTKAFDESKMQDPSLIIYYPARNCKNCHIITNGDQTDTVYNSLKQGGSFEAALQTRTFEPDGPNFTPRISGIIDLDDANAYELSILKSIDGDGDYSQRNFFKYETAMAGIGHCIHTYVGDGNPLPSFAGEPYPMPLFDTIDETGEAYWSKLNSENKISLLVKFIDVKSGKAELKLYNKHLGD